MTIVLQLTHAEINSMYALVQDKRMQENCITPIRKSFNIVVTGSDGSGTTAIINRITGSASEVDHCVGHVGGLTRTKSTLAGYDVVLWETPDISIAGFWKCPKPSVLILCVDITDSRFRRSHGRVLTNVSRYFSKRVWNNCIIALTFADQLQTRPSWENFDTSKIKEELGKEVEKWKNSISENLISKNVPQEVVGKILFFPIAHIQEPLGIFDEFDALETACIGLLNKSTALKSSTDSNLGALLGGVIGLGVASVVFPPLIPVSIFCGIISGWHIYRRLF